MDTMNIMLCCGAGISSGFLATAAQKAAKKAGIKATVKARSHSDVGNYMDSVDILMIGPHYKMELSTFEAMAKPHGVPVIIIPEDVYAMIDGTRVIEIAQETLANK